MTRPRRPTSLPGWLWALPFLLLVAYVAARMNAFHLEAEVAVPDRIVSLPNTFATVDHPFHVARAEMLWRELGAGRILRWVGQHQGGYPVEFYPLGEAWLEVLIRALSLGTLTAAGAHTLAVVAIFLLPGAGYLALSRKDRFSPAVALLALVLHVSLPGGWYDGGYTELVQWGLVTNVAGATATFLVLPPLVRFLTWGPGWTGALAAGLAAVAIYSNPRSAIGLVAVGAGASIAAMTWRSHRPFVLARRLAIVAALAALLAAPQLLSLARYGDLYAFVHYDSYEGIAEYLTRSVHAVSPVVAALAVAGLLLAFAAPRLASQVTASSLLLYVALTLAVAFVPFVAGLAPQLEPTRLMPLQRLLTIYLAAVAVWSLVDWMIARIHRFREMPAPILGAAPQSREPLAHRSFSEGGIGADPTLRSDPGANAPYGPSPIAMGEGVGGEGGHAAMPPRVDRGNRRGIGARASTASPPDHARSESVPRAQTLAAVVTLAIAVTLLLALTRPLPGPPPDPASPAVPAAGLYPVLTSAQPEQADLEAAVRAADTAAEPGTALLVIGSALSWHQPLWAPLWTPRPLFYENWLWYWHPDHAGTPRYAFRAGHHYPDPEAALDPAYLARHGIGAVVVTGPAREAAAGSDALRPLRSGTYDAYAVIDPVTTVTLGDQNAASSIYRNGYLAATADAPAPTAMARANWFPRWEAVGDGEAGTVSRRADGSIEATFAEPVSAVALRYAVQPLDWLGRALAMLGLAGLLVLAARSRSPRWRASHWYAERQDGRAWRGVAD